MEYALLLGFIFGAGIVLQAFFLQLQNKSLKSLLLLLLALLFSFLLAAYMYFKMNFPDDMDPVVAFYFFICFSVGIAFIYKKEILPVINEAHILSLTILFWFIFLVYFYSDAWYIKIFTVLALVPTIGTIFICFTTFKLKNWVKLFFYVWFLVMTIFIMISYFPFGNISFFWSQNLVILPDPITVFLSGLVFVILLSYIAYVFYLIPIPGKYQPIDDRIRECKLFARGLIQKYSDLQLVAKYVFLIIIIECAVLFINFYFYIIPNYLLISTILLFVPALFKIEAIRVKMLKKMEKN